MRIRKEGSKGMVKQRKNPACLICKYVIPKDGEPYCKVRQAFTEILPPIRCGADCPQRHTFVDDLPDIHSIRDIFSLLKVKLLATDQHPTAGGGTNPIGREF